MIPSHIQLQRLPFGKWQKLFHTFDFKVGRFRIDVFFGDADTRESRPSSNPSRSPSLMTTRAIPFLSAYLLLALSGSPASEPSAAGEIAVGAIRWDAWHGRASEIGRAMEKSLSPPHWQGRLPFFAQVSPEGSVTISDGSDTVMTREIAHAKSAGLDYWAFCAYGADSPMSLALHRYLAHPARDQVRFCLIGDASHWKPDSFESEAGRLADLMALPCHQTVLGERPLFYLLNLAVESNEAAWAGAGGVRTAVATLRAAVSRRGLPEVYCVAMVPSPDQAKTFAEASGCDAISAYAVQNGGRDAPYAELTAHVETYWQSSLATGARLVPVAMTGWDRRPRVENPVFWEHNEGWGADLERFYQAPTPAELGDHIRSAVEWTRRHPIEAEARAVIVYAWNEFDEGGWICPTLGEGDARVRALGAALARP
jgi:hypothetical protein